MGNFTKIRPRPHVQHFCEQLSEKLWQLRNHFQRLLRNAKKQNWVASHCHEIIGKWNKNLWTEEWNFQQSVKEKDHWKVAVYYVEGIQCSGFLLNEESGKLVIIRIEKEIWNYHRSEVFILASDRKFCFPMRWRP